MAQKQDVENLLQQSKKKLDKDWSKDSNRLYQIKARLLTGEKLDKKTIEELVAVCKNENPGQIENHLSSGYVGGMLRQEDRKCKVYKKNNVSSPNSVSGFAIYTFNFMNRTGGNVTGTILQCKVDILRSIIDGTICDRLLLNKDGENARYGSPFVLAERCGSAILKDLETLVLKTINESGHYSGEMVLDAIDNVCNCCQVGFYEKLGFKKNGPKKDELQSMIKKIDRR